MENPGADDAEDIEVLRSLADAIDARDRASVAILNVLRALKGTCWFARWCEEHGIKPDQLTTTTKASKVIRAVLEQDAAPHSHAGGGAYPKPLQH